MNIISGLRTHGAKLGTTAGALVLSTVASVASAQSTNPASGVDAVTQLQGTIAGYGPVMFGLAIAAVGVMIGVKWIKRARGAA